MKKTLTRKVFNFQGFIGVSGRVGLAGDPGAVVSFIYLIWGLALQELLMV